MSAQNKELVRRLSKGFETDDAEAILSCLADDIRWEVAGVFTAKQLHHTEDTPTLRMNNEIAKSNTIAVEGTVEGKMKDITVFKAWFNKTYRLENEKIKEISSCLVPINQHS
jgi:uncharacterized protein